MPPSPRNRLAGMIGEYDDRAPSSSIRRADIPEALWASAHTRFSIGWSDAYTGGL